MKFPIKKPQPARSLTTTLAIIFFTLSAVVLLASSALQTIFNIQIQQKTISSQQQVIAQDAAKAVSGFIQEKFSVLETTIWLANPAVASPDEQKQMLESLLGLQPSFRQLVLLDAQDQELAQASRLSLATSKQFTTRLNREAMAQIRQEQRYISSAYVDDITSEPMVILAVPATNALGDFQGTLLVEVNLKFMWDLVDQLEVGETGRVYVVDRVGNLLAFSHDIARVLRGENVRDLSEVSEFITNPEAGDLIVGELDKGIDGGIVFGTFAPLGTPNWAVVTELPWQEAYREVIQLGLVAIGISLAIAILAGLLGVYIARRLAAPLVNLTNTATRITEGELELQAAIAGTTEVSSLATVFNTMTSRLRQTIDTLEERVVERTRQVETVVETSQKLTGILELDDLLHQVVNITKETFKYYHVHIYLLDDQKETLYVAEGYGQAGAEMKRQGHSIPLAAPQSLVARAARESRVITVENVRDDPTWLPNPLLPDTHSEMAVPVMLGDEIVGVLDVQSEQVGGLTAQDEATLQALANQVAIAVRNARLFAQTQTALVEAQKLQRLYTGEAWERLATTHPTSDYEYRRDPLPLLSEIVTPEAIAAWQQAQTIKIESGRSGLKVEEQELETQPSALSLQPVAAALATPLKLRDAIIGVLGVHAEDPHHSWSEDEIALIESVSEQMSLALENARLLEETQRAAWRDQAVSESTAKVWSSSEIEEVLRVAVAQLGDKLGASEVVIRLGTEAELVREE